MELTAIHTDSDFQNASVPAGEILTFAALDDNGKLITRYKDSSGTFGTISSENTSSPGSGETESSPFSLVRITSHRPRVAAFTAPERIVVSGLGILGDEEYGETFDAGALNGTYTVMDEYASERDMKRVYKHSSGEYYLACYEGGDWDEWSTHWYISRKIGSYGYDAILLYYGEEIPNGSGFWYGMNFDATFTTQIYNCTYPEQSFLLLGDQVQSYDCENHLWNFGEALSLDGYEKDAVVNNLYAVYEKTVIGSPIGFFTGLPGFGAVFYAPLTTTDTKALTGQGLDMTSSHHAVVYEGRACLHIAGEVLNIRSSDGGFVSGNESFSLHIRVCFQSFNKGGIIVLGSNDGDGIAINLVQDGDEYFFSFSDGNDSSYKSGDFKAELNTWYSLCLVRTDTGADFYVNNNHVRTADFYHYIRYNESYSGIGGRKANGYGDTYKDVYVCDAIMYDRDLTPREIALLAEG